MMFAWLLRLFRKADPWDVYQPYDRLIYAYFDGEKQVKADPYILEKRLMEVGPELAIDIKVSRSVSKDAKIYHDKMIQKIQDIFKVKSLEEGGLTELETINLFDHYLAFTGMLKKNSSLTPTFVTGTSPPIAPSSDESPTTSSSSASGSTGDVNSTAKPEPLPKEPVSQSIR